MPARNATNAGNTLRPHVGAESTEEMSGNNGDRRDSEEDSGEFELPRRRGITAFRNAIILGGLTALVCYFGDIRIVTAVILTTTAVLVGAGASAIRSFVMDAAPDAAGLAQLLWRGLGAVYNWLRQRGWNYIVIAGCMILAAWATWESSSITYEGTNRSATAMRVLTMVIGGVMGGFLGYVINRLMRPLRSEGGTVSGFEVFAFVSSIIVGVAVVINERRIFAALPDGFENLHVYLPWFLVFGLSAAACSGVMWVLWKLITVALPGFGRGIAAAAAAVWTFLGGVVGAIFGWLDRRFQAGAMAAAAERPRSAQYRLFSRLGLLITGVGILTTAWGFITGGFNISLGMIIIATAFAAVILSVAYAAERMAVRRMFDAPVEEKRWVDGIKTFTGMILVSAFLLFPTAGTFVFFHDRLGSQVTIGRLAGELGSRAADFSARANAYIASRAPSKAIEDPRWEARNRDLLAAFDAVRVSVSECADAACLADKYRQLQAAATPISGFARDEFAAIVAPQVPTPYVAAGESIKKLWRGELWKIAGAGGVAMALFLAWFVDYSSIVLIVLMWLFTSTPRRRRDGGDDDEEEDETPAGRRPADNPPPDIGRRIRGDPSA